MIKKFLFLFFYTVKIFSIYILINPIFTEDISMETNSYESSIVCNNLFPVKHSVVLSTTKNNFITLLPVDAKDAKAKEIQILTKYKKAEKARKDITDTLKQKKGPLIGAFLLLLTVVFWFPVYNLWIDFKYYLIKQQIEKKEEIVEFKKSTKNSENIKIYKREDKDQQKLLNVYELCHNVVL